MEDNTIQLIRHITQDIDFNTLQRMKFIYSALQDGWSVKKIACKYIFTKKHENDNKIMEEDYIKSFITQHTSI
jgi:hypothetical protein